MLDDIEDGKIDVVITKDLSRLGRDHLKVGHFTEIYFPMKQIRYIAIHDGVDTANSNNDIAALKNVMNFTAGIIPVKFARPSRQEQRRDCTAVHSIQSATKKPLTIIII